MYSSSPLELKDHHSSSFFANVINLGQNSLKLKIIFLGRMKALFNIAPLNSFKVLSLSSSPQPQGQLFASMFELIIFIGQNFLFSTKILN